MKYEICNEQNSHFSTAHLSNKFHTLTEDKEISNMRCHKDKMNLGKTLTELSM